MESINQIWFKKEFEENKNEFSLKLFTHNNFCILILSIYLTGEQLCYGYFLAPDAMLRRIHFVSACVMSVYFLLAAGFRHRKVTQASFWIEIYELSFGLYGFASAMLRAFVIKTNTFAVPTVYIAVIYGFAVFFYFHPVKSFILYAVTCICMIFLLPAFKSEFIYSNYTYDIISNNIIAWIASCIGFHRFRKEFYNQKMIQKKNETLQEKTREIEKINKELRYNSIMDSLTNLHNRRRLNQLLEHEYSRCEKSGSVCSLILLDIDFFKSINDTYGHSAGDRVLEEVAALLKRSVREDDSVGRWGGEEFLVICPDTAFDEAHCIAEQIRSEIANFEFHLGEKITCSLGISVSGAADTVPNLIQRADRGLYKAKDKGRNRVEKGE